MTSRATPSGASVSAGVPERATRPPVDPFILTLCQLTAPVNIRPPKSPHLKRFTFFTSRSRRADGSHRLLLHMGYFATLEEAQKWRSLFRSKYPGATAMRAPAELLRKRDAALPTLPSADAVLSAATSKDRMPPDPKTLTDTEVHRAPEARRASALAGDAVETSNAGISLRREEYMRMTPTSVSTGRAAPNRAVTTASPSSLPNASVRSKAGGRLTAPSGRRTQTLEETLEMLAASEIWNDEESFSETGVRHLKIEVQKTRPP